MAGVCPCAKFSVTIVPSPFLSNIPIPARWDNWGLGFFSKSFCELSTEISTRQYHRIFDEFGYSLRYLAAHPPELIIPKYLKKDICLIGSKLADACSFWMVWD